jgi:membrane protein DedA with SNARE-associated domain
MERLIAWITECAPYAHWLIFGAIVLTGFSIPLSIDLIIAAGAMLAAQVVPENMYRIFFAILIGCYCAAIIAYWLGRLFGRKLVKVQPIARLFSQKRLDKVERFYAKYGVWTLIIGRFIPLGVRNVIFMSAGMSNMSFGRFLCIDALGATLWCTKTFLLFYFLGNFFEPLMAIAKRYALYVIPVLLCGSVGFFLYKRSRAHLP